MRKFVDAGGDQEAFEAEHAGAPHRLQFRSVARHDPAPESGIDIQLAFGGGEFLLVRGKRRGGGDAVERHFDEGGDASRGGGARGGLKSFPVGAAGLVDMNVGVDQAGQDGGFGDRSVDAFKGQDRGDDAVVNLDRGGSALSPSMTTRRLRSNMQELFHQIFRHLHAVARGGTHIVDGSYRSEAGLQQYWNGCDAAQRDARFICRGAGRRNRLSKSPVRGGFPLCGRSASSHRTFAAGGCG